MKSKKLLGILMSATLTLGLVAPAVNVQAVQSKNGSISIEGLQSDRYAPGNIEKIIEMLKQTGKISEDATQDEIQQAVQEYLKNDPAACEEVNKKQKEINKKWDEYVKQNAVKQYTSDVTVDKNIKESEVQYVQKENYEGEMKEVRPLVILMEFPNALHGNIEEADTEMYYTGDDAYEKQHYQDMIFGKDGYKGPQGQNFVSMRQFYEEQSGGSMTIGGDIAGWYAAEKGYEYYGQDKGTSHNVNMKVLVKEALAKVAADPNVDLTKYDQVNEAGEDKPDGMIDNVIIIHAGVGQESGTADTNTIWSHSSVVYDVENGAAVPHKFEDSKGRQFTAWGYTTDPEDGGAGVFCHEFGHALGVPDEYDTQYTGNGSAVGDWSIMCNGSWTGTIGGTEPSGFSPEHKQYYQTRYGGNWIGNGQYVKLEDLNEEGIDCLLDEANSRGTNNEVIRVHLPKSSHKIHDVFAGTYDYYSGKVSDADNSMSATIDLKDKKSATLKFKTMYDIEKDWDYASIQVREVGTENWVAIQGKSTTDVNPNGQNPGYGLTGNSGGWIDEEFSLDAFAGKEIEFKFHYFTDANTEGTGLFADDITVVADGETIFTDDGENETKFTLDGFMKFDGNVESEQYYLLEWRNHAGSDAGLAHAFRGRMSYDPGLLVWYIDEFYSDNWTGAPEDGGHQGYAHTGIVDADKEPIVFKFNDGKTPDAEVSSSLNMHDAAFSLRRSSTFFFNSSYYNAVREDKNTFMHPYFDDSRSYNHPMAPSIARNLPNFGLKIYVTGESKDRSVGKIHIVRTTPTK